MPEGGYRGDVAWVQDAGFGGFARDAAPGLLRRLRAAGIVRGLVVDLGCGSGVWAEILLDAGYDVLGVDLSADLLDLARRRAPGARFVHASAFAFDPPPCVAVTAIGEVLGYGLDAHAAPQALAALLARVHGALAPGGLLLFDVAGPGRERSAARRTWAEGGDWVLCLEAREDAAARRLERQITVFRRVSSGWRRSDEVHTLTLHEPDDVLAALAAAGFEARVLRGYGRLRLGRGHTAFAAVRRRDRSVAGAGAL